MTDARLERIEKKLDVVIENHGQRLARLETRQNDCPARHAARGEYRLQLAIAIGALGSMTLSICALLVALRRTGVI